MKATRFLAMAAAAVALAACSSDELASVEQQPAARGMKPVEFPELPQRRHGLGGQGPEPQRRRRPHYR
ncbi:MAG: hypothetical protein ACSW8I_10610 [bacterium]